MMDDAEIARLREINEKATPGEWIAEGDVVRSSESIRNSYIVIREAFARDAAYIAAFDPPTTRSLLDAAAALEKARKERDEANRRFQVENDQVTHLHMVIAEQDGLSVTHSTCFDRVVVQRDAAQQDAREARALIEDIKQWAGQRCPCDNDEPKICPLCSADVSTDRCMAVDVSFPRAIRARIEAMLEKRL